MKKASWILLTVVGVAITLISLVSAVHAYRTRDDYGIGHSRVSKVAGGDAGVATSLRGIRGTSAAYGAAYGVLFLAIVLGPYRRGDVWAWKALLVAGLTQFVLVLLPHPDPRHAARRRPGGEPGRPPGRGAPARRRPAQGPSAMTEFSAVGSSRASSNSVS